MDGESHGETAGGERGESAMRLRGRVVSSGWGRRVRLSLIATAFVIGVVPAPPTVAAGGDVEIEVVSNRADLVSGGDALVAISVPDGADPADLVVELDRTDVTTAFADRPNGRFMGLVTGLAEGDNELVAQLPGGAGASIAITNHPIGGPIFSGEQVQPWICETEQNGLGPPVDDQCNAPTVVSFSYMPEGGDGFEDYDPNDPPSDVATITTDDGEEVPYIVRRERGTMNRGIHDIAVLYDPSEDWEPWAPQRGWNGKILWPFGASCNPDYRQRTPSGVMDDMALSRGFMVANSSMNVLGSNCDTVTSAETVMMMQEHIKENYGPLRYVIAEGCSGGSIGQQVVANAYPGLLDGLLPSCTYPDAWSMAEVPDCRMLLSYFTQKSPHLWPNPAQQSAVSGHASMSSCVAWNSTFGDTQNPTVGCGLPEEMVYHPEDNPDGARCTLQDFQKGIWPLREEDGFGQSVSGNVGIQYGLRAVNSGLITPEQFVDLNEKIGGLTIDLVPQDERDAGDPDAGEVWFRTGARNDGRHLDRVAILDVRGTSNFEFHTDIHSHTMRQRLIDANGHANNHVLWKHASSIVTPSFIREAAFDAMDEWLAGVEADPSNDPIETKVVRNKPARAQDACYAGTHRIYNRTLCTALYPYFGTPRIVAGETEARGHGPCVLKPLDRGDYEVGFSDEQWASLQATFPDGVCDYNQPSPDFHWSVPWLTFEDGWGGEPVGPAPVSEPM